MSNLSPLAITLHQCHAVGGWERVAAEVEGMVAAIVDVKERARPLSEWNEDMGDVLWWAFPIEEAPWVGTPNDRGRTMRVRICCGRADNEVEFTHDEPGGGWPGYHTHWTPLPPPPADREARVADWIRDV